MARARRSAGSGGRWLVVAGAIAVAAVTFYVLFEAGSASRTVEDFESSAEPLEDIDAKSRARLREVLRDADSQDPDADRW